MIRLLISSLGICQTLKLEIPGRRKVENGENGQYVRLGQIVNFTFWAQKLFFSNSVPELHNLS